MPTYEETLDRIATQNENVVVMTAENRAAIRNLPPKLGARFIDVGIAEQTMIGAAAGLALRGRIPICHSLATFLTLRAFEFIRTDVGIPSLPVKLVGGVPGFLSDGNGPTHQAIEDIALMRGIPNMQVVCPADEDELVAMLPKIIDSGAPTYVRYYAGKAAVDHATDYALGKAETFGDGRDVAILTYGFLLREALKAREILEARGTKTRVVNLRSLEPIDEEAIARAREAKLLVTFEDHFLTGGLTSIVGEIFLRRQLTAKVLPIALEKRWFKPALLADVLAHEGFTGEAVAQRITSHINQ
jgi:transketolase